MSADTSDEGRVGLLLAVCVWGTGQSGLFVGRRGRVFTATPLRDVAQRLAAAMDLMASAGPVAAYTSLSTQGPYHVKHLGPAFFTKFLYFAAGHPSDTRPQPLILDRRVALGLNKHYGWSLSTTGWSGYHYGQYLAFADEQAAAAGEGMTPAGFELALFRSGTDQQTDHNRRLCRG